LAKHYVGEWGTQITVNCVATITTADPVALLVRKPDNTRVVWIPTVNSATALVYTTVAGDFNKEGKYSLQASITAGGWRGYGETAEFQVYEKNK